MVDSYEKNFSSDFALLIFPISFDWFWLSFNGSNLGFWATDPSALSPASSSWSSAGCSCSLVLLYYYSTKREANLLTFFSSFFISLSSFFTLSSPDFQCRGGLEFVGAVCSSSLAFFSIDSLVYVASISFRILKSFNIGLTCWRIVGLAVLFMLLELTAEEKGSSTIWEAFELEKQSTCCTCCAVVALFWCVEPFSRPLCDDGAC